MADNSTMFAVMESPYIDTRSPSAIGVTILSLIAILLCVPPMIQYIKSRNLPATTLVGWVILSNLFNFINVLIWPTDNLTHWWNGSGLCDIEVKLMIAATVGVTGALACIFRSLAVVLDTDNTVLVPTDAQRRRRLAFEIFFCFLAPAYLIAVHYIVQPSRYYIFGIAGCNPSFDNSWPTTLLVFVWPVVFSVVAAVYCSIVIYRLHKYRSQFASIIVSSSSNLNKSRFLRLFVLALFLILMILPAQLYVFYRNVSFPRQEYSWSRVHGPAFSDIILVPNFGVENFDRWIQVASGFLVFLFFGFGRDATLMYRSWLLKIGLDRIFPSLEHPHLSQDRSSPSLSSRIGSKAMLIFRRGSRLSNTSLPTRETSLSTTTEIHTPSPSDPIKSFIRFPQHGSSTASSTPSPTRHLLPAAPSISSHFLVLLSRLNPFSRLPTSASDDVEKQTSSALFNRDGGNTTVQISVWSAGRSSTTGSPVTMGSVKVKRELVQESEREKEEV